ncbi:LptA/OstA family protein [Carboxydochorda subterranea]|uniref:LptA/OstA family protein n=1 Tax=Carboxydichorda subterranea TaxID=3109565 RepID=A0ABZ1C2F7_9FIRM|nr:LptA/OstA family protein [Limnochorda sp. L945t]WRP18975.1 LptA/OstA family protein [Limnochorda sp. L945t]
MRLRRAVVAASLGVLLAAEGAAAQAAAQPSAPGPAGQQAPVRIRIVGASQDELTGQWDPARQRMIFMPPKGRVVVEWSGWRAEGARLEWDPEGRVAVMTGSVRVYRPDVDAQAERLDAWYQQDRARLSGSARVDEWALTKGEQRGAHLRTLTAETIEMDEAKRLLVARGSVQVRQDDPRLEASGDDLVYDRNAEKVVLTSANQGVHALFDRFELSRASRVEYDVKTEQVRFFGPADIQQLPSRSGD